MLWQPSFIYSCISLLFFPGFLFPGFFLSGIFLSARFLFCRITVSVLAAADSAGNCLRFFFRFLFRNFFPALCGADRNLFQMLRFLNHAVDCHGKSHDAPEEGSSADIGVIGNSCCQICDYRGKQSDTNPCQAFVQTGFPVNPDGTDDIPSHKTE